MDFDLDAVDDTTKLDVGIRIRKPPAKKAKVKKAKPRVRVNLRPLKKKSSAGKLGKRLAKVAKKSKKPVRPVVRTERLDMRLSKAEKAKVNRIAKKLKRTVTSIVYEAVAKLK